MFTFRRAQLDDDFKKFDVDQFEGGHGHGHGHDHGHDEHDHDHDHEETAEEKKAKIDKAMYQLKCVTIVAFFFIIAQGVGGYMANSIAILTDCAHLASDTIGFIMGILALKLTERSSTNEFTYGW